MPILLLIILNVGIVALLLAAFFLLRGSRSSSDVRRPARSHAEIDAEKRESRRERRRRRRAETTVAEATSEPSAGRRGLRRRRDAALDVPSTPRRRGSPTDARDETTAEVVNDRVEQDPIDGIAAPVARETGGAPARSRAVAAPADSLDLRVGALGATDATVVDLRTDTAETDRTTDIDTAADTAITETTSTDTAPSDELSDVPMALRPGRRTTGFRPAGELFDVDRPALLERDPSRIRVIRTSSLHGPERAALVGGVMRTLGTIGLDPAEIDGRRSRLATEDGRRAAINVDSLDDGADVIDVIVDASLASDALRALTAWHRHDLNTTDGVRIRAWAG